MRTIDSMVRWKMRRMVCWARGHPQEVGIGYPDEHGGAELFRIRTDRPVGDGIAVTQCQCHRTRVVIAPEDPFPGDVS